MTTTEITPISPAFELKQKVGELGEMLLAKHPRMPTLLREIHTSLRAQPENVTLLDEEEICKIVSGLKVQTSTEFAASVNKPAAVKSAAAKIKSLGADAF